MAIIVLRDAQISVDPDEIVKIEIDQPEDGQFRVRLFLKGSVKPQVLLFSSKAAAIAFYRAVWSTRSTDFPVEDQTGVLASAGRPSTG